MYYDFRFYGDHRKEIGYAKEGLSVLRNAAVLASFLASMEDGGTNDAKMNDEDMKEFWFDFQNFKFKIKCFDKCNTKIKVWTLYENLEKSLILLQLHHGASGFIM